MESHGIIASYSLPSPEIVRVKALLEPLSYRDKSVLYMYDLSTVELSKCTKKLAIKGSLALPPSYGERESLPVSLEG